MSGWKKKRLPLQFAEGIRFQGRVPVQEDSFELNPERGIFLLADGFGGAPGRNAAELAVRSIRKFLEQEAGDLDATLPFELRPYYSLAGNVLLNAVSLANRAVLEMNRGRTPEQSGGASVIAGYLEGRLLSVAQVGACRLVLRRGDAVRELVSPNSLLRQVDPFAEEGEGDSIPLMSLGTANRLEPAISEFELRPGDQLLLETSGVRKELRAGLLGLQGPSGLGQWIDGAGVRLQANASMIWRGF
jgi:serine/threonine protein phosphatase PrpC